MQNKVTKEQLHEVWYQCMGMAKCDSQTAIAFISKVRPIINFPLTPAGQNLLMLASSISSINLVRAILSNKPNIAIKDAVGRTALHFAAAVGSIEIFQILVKCGCDPHWKTIGGETPLSKACLFAQSSVIEWYLNNCLEAFEQCDNVGKKPLDVLRNSGQELYAEVKQAYTGLQSENSMKE